MKIVIAMPSWRAEVNFHTLVSLMQTVTRVKQSQCEFIGNLGNSILPMARNQLVAEAMSMKADKIVMIDDDISWESQAFQRLVLAPKTIVAGVYQKKPHDMAGAMNPQLAVSSNPGGLIRDPLTGLVEVDGAATGFMCVDRSVFEDLKPFTQKIHDDEMKPEVVAELYDYFDYTHQIKNGHTYKKGEDFAFCQKARKAGHKTWIDPDIKLNHCLKGFKFGASLDMKELL